MGKINVLSFEVANLIAAGEVVDRPASVIKELMENAIDSGADRITVEIQHGGVTFMSVSDNGCGMEPEDLPVAIRRHATSKIREASDLDGIATLGFRGEAPAAIASVSHLRIISKVRGADTGAMLEADGGSIIALSERGASDGTKVIVEDLFANVPARRKFLKKDVTESAAVTAYVEKIALSRPDIAIRLIVDGNQKIDTVGDGNLRNTVYSLFGKDFASKLLPAELTVDGIRVSGFIGRTDNVRANRNYQNFFINGRYIRSKTACAAIEQAYTSYIPPDKFPCCILNLELNPAAVDVNVHPAKLEVKFSNERPVFEAVYYAVRNALEQNVTRPDMDLGVFTKKTESAPRVSDMTTPVREGRDESLAKRQISAELYTKGGSDKKKTFERITAEQYVKEYVEGTAKKEQRSNTEQPRSVAPTRVSEPEREPAPIQQRAQQISNLRIKTEADSPAPTLTVTERDADENARSIDYRIVGEVFNSYVIVENGDRMLLIDKHAAHERIIFEQLRKSLRSASPASQMLLLPIEVMMTSEEIRALSEYRTEVEATGFEFTTGKYAVSVTAIPEGIEVDAVSDMLTVMAERIRDNTGSAMLTRDIIYEKALYQASCKAAIKAGREYPPEHTAWVVDKLMQIPDITFCPHGRPVAMIMSHHNIDKQFERC